MVNAYTIWVAIFAVIPPILWLLFFLRQDKLKPEPPWVLSRVFIAGAVSAWLAGILQLYLIARYPQFNGLLSASLFTLQPIILVGLIGLAFIEEVFKFVAVYITASKSKYFDESIDRMIYMITGSLGFAAFENILYLLSAGESFVSVNIFRAIGAILLHAVAGGFIGYYWSKGKIILGIVLAVIIHALFNYLLIYSGNTLYAVMALTIFALLLFKDFAIIRRNV
ncbi:MAG: PrsW family intramembrane metalloprotease [Candidatus Colwellbacteria bacterium]|nr:PrsW family intramembrane metalloprotease [Candidatus Colwellbacteria bacterium]